jgi:acyl-CoA thioesterase I
VFFDNGAVLWHLHNRVSPLRILAIGSSSTQGVGATAPAFSYPAQLGGDMSATWGIATDVRNAGVGGELASVTVDRLVASLSTKWPDLVIWQVGTNDAVTGADDSAFRSILHRGVGAALATHTPMVLVDPQLYPGIKDIARYERYVDIIEDVGASDHVPVFSRFALMQQWDSDSKMVLRNMLSADAFHMGDRGYACFAQRLASDLAQRWRDEFLD